MTVLDVEDELEEAKVEGFEEGDESCGRDFGERERER